MHTGSQQITVKAFQIPASLLIMVLDAELEVQMQALVRWGEGKFVHWQQVVGRRNGSGSVEKGPAKKVGQQVCGDT